LASLVTFPPKAIFGFAATGNRSKPTKFAQNQQPACAANHREAPVDKATFAPHSEVFSFVATTSKAVSGADPATWVPWDP